MRPPRGSLLVALVAALAGCEMQLDNGVRLKPGEREPATIMCPGAAPFAGFYDYKDGLVDAAGNRIGSASKCAWVPRAQVGRALST